MKRYALAFVFMVGCSGDKPDPGIGIDAYIFEDAPAPPADGASGPLVLTSLQLTEGGTFPALHTCDDPANSSPELAWTGDNHGALSYAVELLDTANDLTHSIIYDIPVSAHELPAALAKVYAPPAPAGTHQAKSISNTPGYYGPCPPPADPAHLYKFTLYALDVATLPGTNANTARADLIPLIDAHKLATASLTSSYDRN
ncbi:MAG: YbhB/YbcL family Raf kinase inhibitor-like protein [Kofleriaceae bacterium]